MKDEKILQDEILSDEELDKVSGSGIDIGEFLSDLGKMLNPNGEETTELIKKYQEEQKK